VGYLPPVAPMDARYALLHGLIDDAGLFPPARKPMARAVADHAAARAGPARWMLGRFLCPVSRLEELARHAPLDGSWSYGAIFDGDGDDWLDAVRGDLCRVAAFAGRDSVAAVEARLPPGAAVRETIESFARALGEHGPAHPMDAFLEVSTWDPGEIEATLGAIAATRSVAPLGAKVRCGGLSAAAFPPAAALAAFVDGARRYGVPFKATAGLHHPFRTVDAELGVLQHGFVNLLAATALPAAPAVELIEDADPRSFAIERDGLRWRAHRADGDAVARARALFTGYGCCRFEEPVDDLTAAGVLPLAAADAPA
jgi:hypothetical protein